MQDVALSLVREREVNPTQFLPSRPLGSRETEGAREPVSWVKGRECWSCPGLTCLPAVSGFPHSRGWALQVDLHTFYKFDIYSVLKRGSGLHSLWRF